MEILLCNEQIFTELVHIKLLETQIFVIDYIQISANYLRIKKGLVQRGWQKMDTLYSMK
jgi:hypothetical protein